MSFTPGAMRQVVKMVREDCARKAPRAGMKQADMRYLVGGLEAVEELVAWIELHEAAIAKAAKSNVPWRSTNAAVVAKPARHR